MADLLQDVRYGLRTLRNQPGFTAVAAFSLALGIGANTAIFSLVDTLLVRQLPVRHPQELVLLRNVSAEMGETDGFSLPESDRFRALKPIFADVTALDEPSRDKVDIDGKPGVAIRQRVAPNFFAALGVKPALGRTFSRGDGHAVVLAYRYWKRRFDRNPAALGAPIVLGGSPATVIGVAPPEFFGVEPGTAVDLWDCFPPGVDDTRDLALLARLQPGVTARQAHDAAVPVDRTILEARTLVLYREALQKVAPKDRALAPEDPPKEFRLLFVDRLKLAVIPAAKGFSELREQFSEPLALLMALVGVVLLIACANVANLLLARSGARRREIAVRMALGAGRRRLIRQLLTESLLLAGLGGIAGLFLASWATGGLLSLLPANQYLISMDLRPDARILAYTAALSLLTGLLFGTAPAWGGTQVDVHQALKGLAPGPFGRRLLWSRLLVVAETAACLVLVLGAGLFLRSLVNLKTFDAGFSRETILQARLEFGQSRYQGPRLAQAQTELLERLNAAPGVRSASLSASSFHDGGTVTCCISRPGDNQAAGENRTIHQNTVAPGYFRTMGTPLLTGRDFTWDDNSRREPVAVINQTMARKYFGAENPVGQSFVTGGPSVKIIGIARDAKYADLREETPPMAFYPLLQGDPVNGSELVVRLMPGISVESVTAELRKTVAAVLPGLPTPSVTSVGQQVEESVATDRVIAQLSGFFGMLAMALGCMGIYGVTSYSVARRTGEIGIRMALGAQRVHVLRMVLLESAALVLAGIAIGVPLALLGGRWISAMLFGLQPSDPGTLAAAIGIMLAVALVSSYLPARRAAAVEPISALRYQ